ncbi:MAG: transposase [Syntrophobacteraceae bacterium]
MLVRASVPANAVRYHPLFSFTGNGDLPDAKLRAGNAHSADLVLDLISLLVDRYRFWFKQFWLRGDAAFAGPDLYEFCERKWITCFIRISSNSSLKKHILDALFRINLSPFARSRSSPSRGVQSSENYLKLKVEINTL